MTRLLLAILVFFFFTFVSYKFFTSLNYSPTITEPWLQIDQVKIPVEIAQSATEIKQGLSGRVALDQDKGMLFLFATPSRYRFWMPNMHFPLDFIWLGSDKRIVDITPNVSHDFDPLQPIFYQPRTPAQYVLEVNAGFAKQNKLQLGQLAVFSF